jgi:ubiquitin-conjugating enzyme E2 O
MQCNCKRNIILQVILHEIIDVDKEEDPVDVMILDKKFDIKNKGKSIRENSDGFSQAKVCISLYNVH